MAAVVVGAGHAGNQMEDHARALGARMRIIFDHGSDLRQIA